MLKEDKDPSAPARLENLDELVNAAAEAAERLESPADFLDHAALVSEADALDERAQISLMTAHNAKGLEFPNVFLAGMEEGLFPHSRSLDRPEMIEEERRLCYVGMTRAEQRLHMSWARQRRRYGGGPPEAGKPSRFLRETPQELCELEGLSLLSEEEEREIEGPEEVDLYSERHYVREAAKVRPPYPGKTHNSEDSITQFFRDRGIPVSKPIKVPPAAPSYPPRAPDARPPANAAPRPSGPKRTPRTGTTVEHPKYGRGTVLRREGDGEDAKLTVMFPGHGLKKLIAKYAQLKNDE
jgi:DNA helicase-2/ATP-dependent DNA helicase PcrA